MKFNCDQREFGFDRKEEIYEAAMFFPRSTALCLYPFMSVAGINQVSGSDWN
jgi:hypothetical protein